MQASWQREGQFVLGLYLKEYPVTGLVVESRVKYGGVIQHCITLDHDLELPTFLWSLREKGSEIFLTESEIITSNSQ